MSVTAAANKVGLKKTTAFSCYHEYQDDPEHKIPLPRTEFNKHSSAVLQHKIDNVIRYIVNDNMNVGQASRKADINRVTAGEYYAKYLEAPDRKIPLLSIHTGSSAKRYTQKEITDLIGYIVRDKMSLVEASKKVSMSRQTARRYYLKYLHDPNRKIPDLCESYRRSSKSCTNNQVSSLIGYIINDGMSLFKASVKAHMGVSSASEYYKQYLDDPENKIPTPETKHIRKPTKPFRLDQVENFFCYVIVDGLNVSQAASKAKIGRFTGFYYYSKYMESSIQEANMKNMTYSVEKMKQLVELVQNKKMCVKEAAGLVHLSTRTASEHCQKYLKDPVYAFPANRYQEYTQEDIRKPIDYIRNDKMSVRSAARKIKINTATAKKYYKIYQSDPEHKIPLPINRARTLENRTIDKYTRIIADISKKNPSIKSLNGSHHPESDVLDIEIKKGLEEEDTKMTLKDGK